MKNRYILLLFLCLSLFFVKGQNNWRFMPTLTIGYTGERVFHENGEGSPTNSGYHSINEQKLMPSFGGGFGIERLIGKKKRWGVNLGLHYYYSELFDRNETSYYGPLQQVSSYVKQQTSFIAHQIQSPLEVHFYFKKPGKIRPFFSLGGQVSYQIAAVDYTEYFSTYSGGINYDIRSVEYNFGNELSDIDRFDFGMRYGLGVEFNRLSIEFNRINNNIVKKHGYGNIDCFCYYVPPTEEKVQSTSVSFKFAL